ncbi:LAFE_0D00430g1_1 [Lachancea fermentati]|uniref:LAFE_0D00430g1_1 n=1 Tax=Lachancea fermentati TaxID=4955 RepID=A0A1G4MAR3_LACFM|nr:LAFE_0D00430g1_1 [Lachancea fermentati]
MAVTVGGVLSGVNPFHYNTGSPITLFLFQACIILILSNAIHIVMSKIRQPRVISEVLTGIILGPTVFGQIPNYTTTIFPTGSITGLNLVANFGIILFMFFLGLEVDIKFIKKNMKTALSIGLATLVIPFGFGCLFALPLYNNYMSTQDDIKFTVFMVFIAVSLSITAFPVLCRILAELRLIKERVGVIVLTSGTLNDVFGWILLALCIILSNSQSNPVNVVYILLCTLGWFLLYAFPVRYLLRWVLVKTNEFERSKPSSLITLCILVLTFVSAYFTDIIGVHPIFGAFIAGLIVPRDEGYVVKLAERMEDIPNLVMIPIYFTIAGLNVDLTLLNQGKDWGFTFASIGIAISTKLFAGCITSKLSGLFWRESLAVGILMSCKGIVEIVVLTTGLSAGIISRKVYAMFIFMALISTFVTTPLTVWLFPESYREEIRRELEETEGSSTESPKNESDLDKIEYFKDFRSHQIRRVSLILLNLETINSTLSVLNPLFKGQQHVSYELKKAEKEQTKCSGHKSCNNDDEALTICVFPTVSTEVEENISLKTVYLKELTDRTTDLLQNSSVDHIMSADPNYDSSLRVFEIFSDLMYVDYSNEVMFCSYREKAAIIGDISDELSDITFIPLKGGSYENANSSLVPLGKPNDINQLLSVNNLPDNSFQSITSKSKSRIAFLISNNIRKSRLGKLEKTELVLFLPELNLEKSDYFALYLVYLMVYGASNDKKKLVNLTIFANSRNTQLQDFIERTFSDLKNCVKVVRIDISKESYEDESNTTLIDEFLESDVLENNSKNIEGSLLVISDSEFSSNKVFNKNTGALIAAGRRTSVDILVCHYSD